MDAMDAMVYEIKLDKLAPRLNGVDLEQLVELYLVDVMRRSKLKTVKGYKFKLAPFVVWWNEVGVNRDWILSADDLPAYERYLRSLNWAWGSRHDAIKRLRQLFRWSHQRGHVPIDFSIFVPRAKGAASARIPVTLADLQKLLDVCWKMGNPLRNRAIIAVLAGTGLRRTECASLLVEKITFLEDDSGYLEPLSTKNDKPRIVAFDAATGGYLRQWVNVLGETKGPLWPSRNGSQQPLSGEGLYKVVMDAAKLAKVAVEMHDLRRLFATTWRRAMPGEGYGKLLQIQLGHEHYNTTAGYLLPGVDEVLEVLQSDAVSPLARLKK